MKLGLRQQEPSIVHLVVELLLLQPCLVLRVTAAFLVIDILGLGLNAMQFDTLAAFLNGAIHMRSRGFGRLVIGNRIERKDSRIVILVRLVNGF